MQQTSCPRYTFVQHDAHPTGKDPHLYVPGGFNSAGLFRSNLEDKYDQEGVTHVAVSFVVSHNDVCTVLPGKDR